MSMIPIVASLCVPLAYWSSITAFNGRRRPGEPPLIKGAVPFLGVALPFGRDATHYIRECQARHGDVFTLFIGGRRMTFVLDPMSYPAVLKAKQLRFAPVVDEVTELAFKLPRLRQRIDLEPLEHLGRTELKGEGLATMTAAMGQRLRVELDSLDSSGASARPLYRMVWELMFRAGSDAVFGEGMVGGDQAEAFATFDRQFPLMVANLPRVLYRDGEEALMTLARGPNIGRDPSGWIRKRHTHIGELDELEIGRLQSSIIWAVNANTIPSTFWALYYILRDAEALATVRAELDARVGAAPLEAEALSSLRMLDSAIREALRLSSGSLTLRHVPEDLELELGSTTYSFRAGDRVCLAPFITHRDPEIFPEPERYRHDRFYVETGVKQFFKGGRKVPLPLMPFGAGVSMCPGRFFAINEIKLFVAMCLRDFDFDFVDPDHATPGFDLSRAGLGIYPPVEDVELRLRRRAPRS